MKLGGGGGGEFYKHICSACFAIGKENRHMVQDCRASSRVAKNEQSVITTVNKSKNSNVMHTKTRVIHNSNVNNGCSSNWKADWS